MSDHHQAKRLLTVLPIAAIALLWLVYRSSGGDPSPRFGSASSSGAKVATAQGAPQDPEGGLTHTETQGVESTRSAIEATPESDPVEAPTIEAFGQVTQGGEPLPRANLRVMAYPDGLELDAETLERAGRSEGPFQWTETDGRGCFSFEALSMDHRWSFAAGGLGFLSLPDSALGHNSHELASVRIPVTPVSGCRVTLRSEGNDDLGLHPSFMDDPWLSIHHLAGPDVPVSIPMMKCFHPAMLQEPDHPLRPWLLFREHPWTGPLATLQCQVRVQGYQPLESMIEATPWAGGYPTRVIDLVLDEAGLGVIRLTLIGRRGRPSEIPSSDRVPTILILGDSFRQTIELSHLGPGPHEIRGIPGGDVRVAWIGWDQNSAKIPSVLGRVGSEPSDIELDLRSLGELEFVEPELAEGSDGAIHVRVVQVHRRLRSPEELEGIRERFEAAGHRLSGRVGGTFEFSPEAVEALDVGTFRFPGPPYVIPALSPGEYEAASSSHSPWLPAVGVSSPTVLEPGGGATLDLTPDRR